jgi:hypothetical protein
MYAMNTIGIAFPTIHRLRTRTRAMCGHEIRNSAIRSMTTGRGIFPGAVLCVYCEDAVDAEIDEVNYAFASVRCLTWRLSEELLLVEDSRSFGAKAQELHAAMLEADALKREVNTLRTGQDRWS